MAENVHNIFILLNIILVGFKGHEEKVSIEVLVLDLLFFEVFPDGIPKWVFAGDRNM